MSAKPTGDLVAFELYSRANDIWGISGWATTEDVVAGNRSPEPGVARDPSFFEAYCLLAVAHDQLYFFGLDHTPARLAAAEAAVRGSISHPSKCGEAHLARAVHLYNGYLDYDGALAELEIARQSLPNDSRIFQLMGFIQRRQGRWEESMRNFERAVELDPRNLNTLAQYRR